MLNKKIIVGRPVNGISLNGNEYLLDANNEIMKFDNEHAARDFLLQNGIKKDDLDSFTYEEITK